ncbi:MAG TPA: flagellar hook protein FlgE [Acidobacteriota bacterium]|nr:flagellar hook protein FlgE [Acidobacteriota bacterium]
MGGAFFTGLSGLVANSLGIEVVGNNLSNTNTVGYKVNNIHFAELISGSNQLLKLGQGARTERLAETFSQGSLQDSQIPTDMAIQGGGFFVVGDGVNSQFYTRAGNFQISPDGFLTNSEGLFVLGYPAIDGEVNLNSGLQPVQIVPDTGLEPRATSLLRIGANLNVDTPEGEIFTTAVSVFDSLGEDHQITLHFTRTASGWDYEVQLPAEDVGGAVGDPPAVLESGSITFDGDGRIDTVTTTGGALPAGSDVTGITISGLANGANDLTFDWDLFDENGQGFITQFNLPNETQLTFQDGNGAGSLTGIVVRRNGVIEGLFSNGETSPLGQLAMAKFTNPQGLVKVASNLYSKTAQSGDPSVGEPGTGGRGVIRGNALESSNVDIAEEFVKLIIFQRAYQANSRLVITADEVVQEAIALKR